MFSRKSFFSHKFLNKITESSDLSKLMLICISAVFKSGLSMFLEIIKSKVMESSNMPNIYFTPRKMRIKTYYTISVFLKLLDLYVIYSI